MIEASAETAEQRQHSRLLFPWDDAEGLTRPLRDPALWARAFVTPKPRKFIKNAAKDVLGTRGIAHTDSDQIGELLMQLLATRLGRAALFHEFKKLLGSAETPESYLAQRLYRAVRMRGIDAPASLLRHQGPKYFLDPAAIEAAPESFSSWSPENILLVSSPYVILQKREAKRIVSALRRFPEVAAFLDAESPRGETSQIVSQPLPSSPNGNSATEPHVQSHPLLVQAATAHVEPVSSTSADAVEPIDSRAVTLADTLRKVVEANERARSALDAGDFDRATLESENAKRLRNEVRTAYSVLRSRDDVVGQELESEISNSAFAGAAQADTWIRDLLVRLRRHEHHRVALVHKRRESLCDDIRRVGLSIPDDLLSAVTLEQVQAIRAREQASIDVETAWQRLLETRDPASVANLDATQRLRLANRLLESGTYPDLAMALFVKDSHISKEVPLEKLLPIVIEHVSGGGAIPAGFWRAVYARVGKGTLGLFDAHRLDKALELASDEDLQARELQSLLLELKPPHHHPLFLWGLESWLSVLHDGDERLKLLIDITQAIAHPKPVALLIEALCDSERYGDALVLAATAAHLGQIDERGYEAARPALLRCMLTACQRPDQYPILKDILSGPETLCRYEDGFLTLLYVSAVIDPRFIDTLIQIDPAVYDFVRSTYPTLVDDWLQTIRVGHRTLDEIKSRERDELAIKQEFLTWEHELTRKSAYTSWPPAQEYQRHIADWLREQFAALPRASVLEEPDELIEFMEETHSLKSAEGTARRNMHSYIKAQLARLNAFKAFALENDIYDIGRFLAIPHKGLLDRLMTEAGHASGVIRELYKIAMQEVSR